MKIDESGFPIYEPCDDCEYSDENHSWCNKFNFRLIGDCMYCPIALEKRRMIKDIIEIQYFIKTTIYGDIVEDKKKYSQKIRSVYENMSVDEVRQNLEEIKYLGVGAIKLNTKERIQSNCAEEKLKAYEEYLDRCNAIELEMEKKLEKSEELLYLTVESLIPYIENMNTELTGGVL